MGQAGEGTLNLNLALSPTYCVTSVSLRIMFLHLAGEKMKPDDLYRAHKILNIYDSIKLCRGLNMKDGENSYPDSL